MPEKYFHIRWPNGEEEQCYSPSSVIDQYLHAGQSYELNEFVSIAEQALNEASERVRMKFGYSCSSALDQLGRIKLKASSYDANGSIESTESLQVSVTAIR